MELEVWIFLVNFAQDYDFCAIAGFVFSPIPAGIDGPALLW